MDGWVGSVEEKEMSSASVEEKETSGLGWAAKEEMEERKQQAREGGKPGATAGAIARGRWPSRSPVAP